MWPKLKSASWEIVKFVVVTAAIVIPIRAYVAQPFIVSGNSMYPTFKNNEYLIIDELSYHLRSPERGEVIVFRFPKQPETHFIKRIIGLPGETVIVKDGTVTIDNGHEQFKLDESYLTSSFKADSTLKLGDHEYFVMGDNRTASLDSRSWGALPADLVTGRVLVRLFPPSTISFLPGAVK
jgi:signal peptidase I